MKKPGLLGVAIAIMVATCLAVTAGESRSAGVGFGDQVEHCTAFVLDNDGHGVFGANFDHTWTDEGLVFVNKRGVMKHSVSGGNINHRIHWTSRYAFATLDEVRGERFSASPTNWSLVFDTKNLRAYFTTRRDRRRSWIDLNGLDLRCGGPVKMMDIHNGGPGDVTGDLIDYSRQLNRFHFERFLSIWGISISPQDITWILNEIEGFECPAAHRRSTRRVTP